MKNKNYILSLSLASISFLILVLLLASWNYNSYKKEKTELFEKINDQLQLVIGDYNDSIFITFIDDIQTDTTKSVTTLFQSYGLKSFPENEVNWSSDSSSFADGNIEIKIDDRSSGLIIEMSHEENYDSFPSIKRRFKTKENIDYDSKIRFEKKVEISAPDSVLSVDIRQHNDHLKVHRVSTDSLGNNMKDEHIIVTHKYNDDIALRFKEKLNQENISVDFTSEEIESEGMRFEGFPLGNMLYIDSHKLEFSNYNAYIFNRILPNLLLSGLVGLLILISFLTMFYSWKKQSDLITFKNEFMSNMTHELKTPISTVGVALEAITEHGIDHNKEKRKEYLDIARLELDRLNLLVDKVLKMSSFDEKVETLLIEEIDLNVLCKSVIRSLKLHLEKHGATVNFNSPEHEVLIRGDKIHLANVIYNIIDNAIKYSDDQARIDIQIFESSNFWNLQISDQGRGIDPKYLNKIFDRFFREPQNDVHDVKGYGLGLNYVKNIIEQHGGKVSIESELNNGTSVLVKLKK